MVSNTHISTSTTNDDAFPFCDNTEEHILRPNCIKNIRGQHRSNLKFPQARIGHKQTFWVWSFIDDFGHSVNVATQNAQTKSPSKHASSPAKKRVHLYRWDTSTLCNFSYVCASKTLKDSNTYNKSKNNLT